MTPADHKIASWPWQPTIETDYKEVRGGARRAVRLIIGILTAVAGAAVVFDMNDRIAAAWPALYSIEAITLAALSAVGLITWAKWLIFSAPPRSVQRALAPPAQR